MGSANQNYNIVGLEIRRPVVEFALERKARIGLQNVHYVATNANIDMNRVMNDINKISNVQIVTIQFPDPLYKKHHKKRRVLTPEFVSSLALNMRPGAQLFIQSDVKDVLEDMVATVMEKSIFFVAAPGYDPASIGDNPTPFDVQTEREISVRNRNLPVYRMLFIRSSAQN
jgi:tRNA (guanine-N7-)-methyltransferase